MSGVKEHLANLREHSLHHRQHCIRVDRHKHNELYWQADRIC